MKINIYTENLKFNKNYEKALNEYIKRNSIFSKTNILKFTKDSLKNTDYIVLVNSTAELISSEKLAEKIKHITTYKSSTISFVILSDNVLIEDIKKYDEIISVSRLDLSKELLPVILSEQIYRAFTIINGKKYHK